MTVPVFLFYLFGALAVIFSLSMVLHVRNTVAGALSLVVTMISLAAIYVLLEAHLVAVIQIMVYAGAIVVLFLFVVMLLNLREDQFAPGRQWLLKIGAGLVGVVALAQLLRLFRIGFSDWPPLPEGFGGYRLLGLALYTDYVLLVELVSLLLLAAIVGALILAKRKAGP
ncbi:MAG: NADH-quinone oxidoreductase subunit J [Myxococcota bacterium]|nr:NADH-quinone oxidoreductase subunit J [Myxococcota bacterium]MDP6242855.1 NADH-quinone oxidoreductase subunit J [Myxococcota bacterium]MDP7076140.1 NADH-quinone oxidoreductase subunit J [Myxococcota bacterium]MDP7301033.1 NADH-quinone oxidoreductase subunit J [Myxococcota bacterium]MDP7434257.1 NADH-quinone oxidoreductase subunit J [Myxococcota bacterium]